MIAKKIKFVDYDGNTREEEFLFNLSKAELLELECDLPGGLQKYVNKLLEEQNNGNIMAFFKKILCMSYGKKSDDGRRFVKSDEITKSFLETEAYTVLLMDILKEEGSAEKFMEGIIPSDSGNVVNINHN